MLANISKLHQTFENCFAFLVLKGRNEKFMKVQEIVAMHRPALVVEERKKRVKETSQIQLILVWY